MKASLLIFCLCLLPALPYAVMAALSPIRGKELFKKSERAGKNFSFSLKKEISPIGTQALSPKPAKENSPRKSRDQSLKDSHARKANDAIKIDI